MHPMLLAVKKNAFVDGSATSGGQGPHLRVWLVVARLAIYFVLKDTTFRYTVSSVVGGASIRRCRNFAQTACSSSN